MNWGRMEASGNAFSPSVVADLLRPLALHILGGAPLPLQGSFPPSFVPEEILKALGASIATPLLSRKFPGSLEHTEAAPLDTVPSGQSNASHQD